MVSTAGRRTNPSTWPSTAAAAAVAGTMAALSSSSSTHSSSGSSPSGTPRRPSSDRPQTPRSSNASLTEAVASLSYTSTPLSPTAAVSPLSTRGRVLDHLMGSAAMPSGVRTQQQHVTTASPRPPSTPSSTGGPPTPSSTAAFSSFVRFKTSTGAGGGGSLEDSGQGGGGRGSLSRSDESSGSGGYQRSGRRHTSIALLAASLLFVRRLAGKQ